MSCFHDLSCSTAITVSYVGWRCMYIRGWLFERYSNTLYYSYNFGTALYSKCGGIRLSCAQRPTCNAGRPATPADPAARVSDLHARLFNPTTHKCPTENRSRISAFYSNTVNLACAMLFPCGAPRFAPRYLLVSCIKTKRRCTKMYKGVFVYCEIQVITHHSLYTVIMLNLMSTQPKTPLRE